MFEKVSASMTGFHSWHLVDRGSAMLNGLDASKSCRRRFLLPHMPEVQFWGNLWNFINFPLTWLSCLSVLFCFKDRTIHFILVLHCHSLVIILPSISWPFLSINLFISIFLTKILLYRLVRFTHFYFIFFFIDIF